MTEPKSDRRSTPVDDALDPEVIAFREQFDERSPLDELVREGARRMLQEAINAEVDRFIDQHGDRRDDEGRRLVNRNDTVLPAYFRRTDAIEELIPWLYLKGISDFAEALKALVGERAKGLSANVIVRLKDQWADEYEAWSKRDLSDKHYVYIWADIIYAKVRLEDDANKKQCMLVLMGATADGKKELIAVLDGYRESKQSWRELLLDLKNRGLTAAPKLAVGDGPLGFWAALREIFPETKEQRCWVHKTANVLNKMPKSIQPISKANLYEIWQAETREISETAFDAFLEKYQAKYPAACDFLSDVRDVLPTFYTVPAGHLSHLWTTAPIGSRSATIRLRHRKTTTEPGGPAWR